jgi:hypothetical protein
MSTSVKHIHNGMRGAPQISGSVGTLIAALDAFFVSGWGVTTALSVNVASGVATATLTPGQTFDRDAVVLVEGATPGALNGEARVLTTSNTSITWATTAADGAATGTITIKYAPQTSWSKVYAGTNKAVYRSTHVASAGHYLRVDDTGTTTARVRGFESMTDVDTGAGPFPTDAQMSGGGYWWKSTAANTNPTKYRIFADERFVILTIAAGVPTNATFTGAPARGFGDPLALASAGDAWVTLLSVAANNSAAAGWGSLSAANASGASGLCACPRAISGLGGSVLLDRRSFTTNQTNYSGVDDTLGAAPSEVDGQIKTARIYTKEVGSTKPPRALIPGVYHIPQTGLLSLLADGDFLAGSGDLAGHRLMAIPDTAAGGFSTPAAMYLVDITGPWR